MYTAKLQLRTDVSCILAWQQNNYVLGIKTGMTIALLHSHMQTQWSLPPHYMCMSSTHTSPTRSFEYQ